MNFSLDEFVNLIDLGFLVIFLGNLAILFNFILGEGGGAVFGSWLFVLFVFGFLLNNVGFGAPASVRVLGGGSGEFDGGFYLL